MRLDKYLVDHGYFESRNRALDSIRAGKITIDGKIVKASQKVDSHTKIEIEESKFYVSRAAQKLESFLAEHAMELSGKTTLDIGSSTGGFAQILLEYGIASLDCVDVGKDQLHHSLRSHTNLSLHEETDIRDFKSNKHFGLITCDVSFISILQIIEDIDRLSHAPCDIIILYKPQFEVGRTCKRDSKGVVQDAEAIQKSQEAFEDRAKSLDWNMVYKSKSKLSGKKGNQEYLYHFTKI